MYLAALVLAVAAACDRDSGDSLDRPWRTGFDTVGDTVVARTTGRVADAPLHELAVELRVGSADGDETQSFATITDIAVDRDGRIYVFDRQIPSLRRYDSTGTLERTIGGRAVDRANSDTRTASPSCRMDVSRSGMRPTRA